MCCVIICYVALRCVTLRCVVWCRVVFCSVVSYYLASYGTVLRSVVLCVERVRQTLVFFCFFLFALCCGPCTFWAAQKVTLDVWNTGKKGNANPTLGCPDTDTTQTPLAFLHAHAGVLLQVDKTYCSVSHATGCCVWQRSVWPP